MKTKVDPSSQAIPIDASPMQEAQQEATQFLRSVFLTAWIIWVPMGAASAGLIDLPIPGFVFYLGFLAPIGCALYLTYKKRGKQGVRELLIRLMQWRFSWTVYSGFCLIFTFVILVPKLLIWLSGIEPSVVTFSAPLEIAGTFLGSMGYLSLGEVGWRGFVLPRFQTNMSALRSSVILGLFYALFDYPVLWYAGIFTSIQDALLSTLFYFPMVVGLTTILTWVFNTTRGSHFMVTFAHATMITFSNFSSIGQHHLRFFSVLVTVTACVAAAGLVWRYGAVHLSKADRITSGAY